MTDNHGPQKKIVIAAGLYPPDIGGPATYAVMLETELPRAGIEPMIVPFGQVRQHAKLWRHLVYTYQLYSATKDCQAIYALDGVSTGLPALIVSRMRRLPLLVRLGGDYAWEQGRMRFGLSSTLDEFTADPSGRPLMVRLLAWLQAFVVRRAQYVIAPSQYLKRIIATWNVPESRIKVIPSALFPLPVTESRDEIRHRLAYDETVLVNAGRLTPWKGIDTLIDVAQALNEAGRPTTLIVAGEGEARATLEAQAARLGIADRVRFVGRLSKEALGATIKGADVFVYNTSYEGLPHQLLEVMDLGVPVVTTDIPGNREVITDGKDGLLVSKGDQAAFVSAVNRIMDNQQLRDRLTQNARVRSKAFAEEIVTKDLITLLDDVLT